MSKNEENTVITVTVSADDMRESLRLVKHSQGKNETREYLNGIALINDNRSCRVVSTDGHRMTISRIDSYSADKATIVLPVKYVAVLTTMLAGSKNLTGGLVEIFVRNKETKHKIVKASLGHGSYEQTCYDWIYPDIDECVQENFSNFANEVVFDRRDMLNALRSSTFKSVKAMKVDLLTNSHGFIRLGEGDDVAEVKAISKTGVAVGNDVFQIHPKYLADALSSQKGYEARLRVNAAEHHTSCQVDTGNNTDNYIMLLRD